MRCRFKELSNVLLSEVNRIVVGCLQPDPDGCEGKRVKARDQTGDICPPALLQEGKRQSGFNGGMKKKWPVNGYCSICIWFPAGRSAAFRAESENTWRGSAGSEDHHTHGTEEEKGNGNLCEEMD